MDSRALRKKFLEFFNKHGHTVVPSSSLLPSDPSVLFTTAGMQQFKEYFLGKKSPYGKSVASCQKCFRTSDIDEVGDERHLTFFEMLGHFSFGDYFKKETIEWTFDFLTKVLKISVDRIAATVFEGDDKIPFDEESYKTWLKFLPEKQIKKNPRKDNVWGPVGDEGPCGAANEVYIDGLEVATLVFVEYFCAKDGSLAPLLQKGVDVGWGLERIAMIAQDKKSIFETDLFEPIIRHFESGYEKERRIVADHIKSAVFLISEGILPSNVEQGYVLRRILRRAIRYGKLMMTQPRFLEGLAKIVINDIYGKIYPELKLKEEEVLIVIRSEQEKFEKTLEKGLKELCVIFNQFKNNKNAMELGKGLFLAYQSYGFPLELSFEEMEKYFNNTKDIELEIEVENVFRKELNKHQEISRAGAEKKFKGGLADNNAQTVKYHTATHLLLAALREVLPASPAGGGSEIYQKGSNITAERLRFDFNYPQKMTDVQIKEVVELVNQKIKEDILVEMKEMPKAEALKIAKVSFDPAKYGETVKVYQIGDFSIELCGGPHVSRTSELGVFKITKEESSGAGVRRIRAILE